MDWRLHNGRAQDILPGEYAGRVNLVVTSPPYDGLRRYGGYADAFDFDAVADALIPTLAPGGVIVWVVADAVVDGSETGTSFRQALGFMDRGLRLHQTLVYERALPRPLTTNRYLLSAQWMFVFCNEKKPSAANLLADRSNLGADRLRSASYGAGRTKDAAPLRSNRAPMVDAKTGKRSQIWRYVTGYNHDAPDFPDAHDHPAIFPYALAADHIRTWSNPGDLVLDPMAGSGTTLRAAVNLGRRAAGVEVNPEYCDLINRRMAQTTLPLDG